jgi:WhiB family transcriptional regulator, redox-sensing transcriptional regulator
MTTVPGRPRRLPLAGRFDAEASMLSTGGVDSSALGGSRRRSAAVPIPNRARTGRELPCQVHDPDLWFADAPQELERAKALCRDCPAQLACLTGAIERGESTGVWGGQILDKGEIVTHKRPRGRPRKGSAMPERRPCQSPAASLAPPASDDVEGAA